MVKNYVDDGDENFTDFMQAFKNLFYYKEKSDSV